MQKLKRKRFIQSQELIIGILAHFSTFQNGESIFAISTKLPLLD